MKIAVGEISIECVQSDVDNQSDVDALFYYLAEARVDHADQTQSPAGILRPGQSLLESLPGFPARHRIVARGPDSLEDNLAAEALKCCLNFFSMAKKGQSFDQEHTGRRFDRYCWTLITRPAKFSIRAAKNSIPLKGCLDFETNSNPVVFSQFGRTNRLKNDLPRSCDRCLRKREPKKCAFAMRYKATRRYSPSISRNFERSSCGTA
ncbi:hypothetical protein BMJ19_02225 [Sinorhizobium medicae]|uniref:Uncharacterized protein n=1 Tax=Sinorhizobium medicae TaxID=110321 RepID=A0ABX4TI48_9HYPH|nr:hypothetical protein BMJ33_24745 [Sinorhizobium medicae]PLU81508.1 hypothetical protein BMJ19_02225 [Sinorhizobium medicae]